MKIHVNTLIGFLFGVLIMWISPVILLTDEPWDAEGGRFFIYLMALFVAGFIGVKYCQKYFYMVAVGIYFGQAIFQLAFIGGGALSSVGLVFMAVYNIFALLGSYLACAVRNRGSS